MMGTLLKKRGFKGRFPKYLGNSTRGQGVHTHDSWGMTANDIAQDVALIHSLGI